MTPKRLPALLVLMTASLSGCGASKTTFTSVAGNYKILMPGTPNEMDQDLPTQVGLIKMHTATALERDPFSSTVFNYTVSYADYPAQLVRPETVQTMLDGSANGSIAFAKSKELSRKSIELDGHPGRELKFEAQGTGGAGTGVGRLRIYLVGDRLYQVLVIGSEAKATDEATKPFLDSFALLKQRPPVKAGGGINAPDLPETRAASIVHGTPNSPPTATATAVAPRLQLPGWGGLVDPVGDCPAQIKGDLLEITVPGTLHDFAVASGKFDAPRVVRDVAGDFTAEVEVPDDLKPSTQCVRPGGVPFHGEGLVFMLDNARFVRLEKAAVNRGAVQPYVLLEGADNGRNPINGGGGPPGVKALRLQRRGAILTASVSQDGQNWMPLPSINANFDGPAKVGVMAVSSDASPFTARFRGLKIEGASGR
ncbi:MAG: hypothetical protein JWN86_751 [Planctomycetota bacterium]|nr:hypothetical protein [Planctomycetota bacterium]